MQEELSLLNSFPISALIPYSGNYLYFEASSPAQPGQTSCFSSKVFPAGSCQLLTFWYHMLGSGIGELRVMVSGSVVWRKSGEQGDKWIQASFEIKGDQEFQVSQQVSLDVC